MTPTYNITLVALLKFIREVNGDKPIIFQPSKALKHVYMVAFPGSSERPVAYNMEKQCLFYIRPDLQAQLEKFLAPPKQEPEADFSEEAYERDKGISSTKNVFT